MPRALPTLKCLALAVLLTAPPRLSLVAQEKDQPSDNIIPIASGITEFPTTLELDGQKLSVTIPYAQQGNTVFVLPVWHVRGVRRLVEGSSAKDLKASDLLYDPDIKGEQRLEFKVVDLLANEAAEKAIQDKLKARIVQRSGQATDKLTLAFAVPQIKSQSYRFMLIGPGRGDETLPAEVPLSADIQRRPDGSVRLTVLPSPLTAVEKENGGSLKLAQAHLQAVGLMRVRFEQTQVLAQVEFVRGAVSELRKAVSSTKDSQGRTPEVFVELPAGGSATSDSQIRQLAQQSLSVTISARAGVETAPILALVQAELTGLLERSKTKVSDENKQVAILLDKQVAITATMGEIHKLAKQDEKQRDAAFKAAFDDYQARASGKESKYAGSVSLTVLGYGGGVSGSAQDSTKESSELRTKREMETARKQFDRVMKEFAGKLPTLSGISLEETAMASSFEQVSKNFEAKKLTTGDTLHRWPLISLSGQLDSALSPQELAREDAILKGDYESLQKLVGSPQQLAEAKANLEGVAKLAEELKAKAAALDVALAKVDREAVAKLGKELTALKLRITPPAAFLGVTFKPRGVVVNEVREGSPAKKADVMAGDMLLSIDGTNLGNYDDLLEFLGKKKPDDEVTLTVWSGGIVIELKTKLGNRYK